MTALELDQQVVFGILSGRASTAIARRLYREFRLNGLQITPEQWVILMALTNKDGITQQELAITTYKDKPSITRLINNLEKQSLVVRSSSKSDKRMNQIYITKSGLFLYEKAHMAAINVMKDALYGLIEDDIRMGERILKQIFKNLA
ncbi:MAG: MarR family transcriptional regulator [Paludibacteraceae bacterium]|jgi:DNA-binding MarR family transcriptional regulator|nr:MarR family transcriptional regulator [Paludibacteraceae bacterium]MBP9970907.1 MarR family transcriptional regulator [Paludibacteraceae bacterium]